MQRIVGKNSDGKNQHDQQRSDNGGGAATMIIGSTIQNSRWMLDLNVDKKSAQIWRIYLGRYIWTRGSNIIGSRRICMIFKSARWSEFEKSQNPNVDTMKTCEITKISWPSIHQKTWTIDLSSISEFFLLRLGVTRTSIEGIIRCKFMIRYGP